jgi:Tfp pilus assembly protein PilO
VIISGIFFSIYVKSRIGEIKRLRASIEELQRGKTDIVTSAEGKDIEILKGLFPSDSNTAGFIEDIYRIAGRYNIKNLIIEQKSTEYVELSTGKVLKVIPKTEQKPNVLYSYPILIIFNTGYRDMAEFIREVQNSERFTSVNTLNVKKAKRGLIVDMLINIYSMEGR